MRERASMCTGALAFAGSFPDTCNKPAGAEAGSSELSPGVSYGWQDFSYLRDRCLPRSALAGKWNQEVEPEMEPRDSNVKCGHLNC